jgi:seryl-tRNA synthetase
MIDINQVRLDPEATKIKLARKKYVFDTEKFLALDSEKRMLQKNTESISAQKNKIAEQIGHAKRSGNEHISNFMAQGEQLRLDAEVAQRLLGAADEAITAFMLQVPNLPADDVPDGVNSDENVVLYESGTLPVFDFIPTTHDVLGDDLGGLDFDAAAELSGARFSVLKGPLARLHRGLIQFMLDTHVDENGYIEVQTPYMVKAEALYGTGQLPKFEDDLFKMERDGMYLIPTAEVTVTNLVANQIVPYDVLPLRYVCHTPCFRREAGAAGRDMKGLIRQHQFEKVELVKICLPEDAEEEFTTLLNHAQGILTKLGIPFRAVALCGGDLGFSSQQTIDLEVWMPGQQAWREISSVSRFGTFQARRMKARGKDEQGKNSTLETINGSGLAAGRTLVAILENYQQEDGSILIPEVLRRYMGDATHISK